MTQSEIQVDELDWNSETHRHTVALVYALYLHEAAEQGSLAHGYPARPEPWFATVLLRIDNDNEYAGLMCLDLRPGDKEGEDAPAIELIYVLPEYRGKGLATALIRNGQQHQPNLQLKGPLSPAGEALSRKTGAPMRRMKPGEAETYRIEGERGWSDLVALCRSKRHKRGNPAAPCRKCRTALCREVAVLYVREAFEAGQEAQKYAGAGQSWRTRTS